MNSGIRGIRVAARLAAAGLASRSRRRHASRAQTVKIGLILTYSGPQASLGEQIDNGVKLYIRRHEKELRPASGSRSCAATIPSNPDTAKRLAQELITRDKVQFLAGVVWTPNAMRSRR